MNKFKVARILLATTSILYFGSVTVVEATNYTSQINTSAVLQNGDTVTVNGGTGMPISSALYAASGVVIMVNGAVIATNLNGTGTGVITANGGTINLGSGSTINATGSRGSNDGIVGATGLFSVDSTNSKIVAENLTVNATSTAAYGVYSLSGGDINLTGQTIVNLTATRDHTFGVIANGSGSKVTVENVKLNATDTNNSSYIAAVGAWSNSAFTGTGSVNVNLSGYKASAAVSSNGTVNINNLNGNIQTTLSNAYGFETRYSGSQTLNSVDLDINSASGIAAGIQFNSGTVTINDSAKLTVRGNNAYGILVYDNDSSNGNNNVQINNADITVSGITRSAIIFNNNEKIGATNASNITINRGILISNQDGILVNGGVTNINFNDVTMNNASNKAFQVIDNSYNTSNLNLTANQSNFAGTATTGNTSIFNLSLNKGSYWAVTGNSNLTGLDSNNSHVDMTKDGNAYSTLTMNNLSGTGGLFTLDIDGTTVNKNDHLYVTNDFNGTQALALNETSGHYVGTEVVGTVLASVKNNNGTFTAVDNEGTLYWERYDLATKASTIDGYTTDWYLKAVQKLDGETTTTDAIKSAGALNYYNWRDDDKLLQRMGELRANGVNDNGIWARIKGSKTGRSGEYNFTNRSTRFEIGYDTTVKRNEEVTRYQGFSVSYAKGNNQYTYGGGDSKQISASFYQTDIRKSGHYLDLIARLSQSESNFSVYDSRHRLITGKISTPGVSISAEYGRKKSLSHSWYIEPQVQFTLGYLGGDDYTTSNKAHVSQNGITSAIGRIGFNVGRDLGHKGNVYLKANLLHEFAGNYGVTMSDYMVTLYRTDTFKDTWFEYGLGVNYALNDNSSVYFGIERSTGGGYTLDWQWNGGIRWKF